MHGREVLSPEQIGEILIEEKGMMNEEEAERRLSNTGDPLVGFCRSIVHEDPKDVARVAPK